MSGNKEVAASEACFHRHPVVPVNFTSRNAPANAAGGNMMMMT